MPLSLYAPAEVAVALAERVRERRLAHQWTQAELARRAGVALSTLKLFEHTGHITLDRLLRIATVLGDVDAFLTLFAAPPARSLDEIEARVSGGTRKYGRSRAASAGRGTSTNGSSPRSPSAAAGRADTSPHVGSRATAKGGNRDAS